MTPLQAAFQQARAHRNIDLVLPVLRNATLHVVVGPDTEAGAPGGSFLTRSPTPERWCVTVAEFAEALARVPWPTRRLSGAELLTELPPGLEIVVVYPDGGDYLTREQLAWYRGEA